MNMMNMTGYDRIRRVNLNSRISVNCLAQVPKLERNKYYGRAEQRHVHDDETRRNDNSRELNTIIAYTVQKCNSLFKNTKSRIQPFIT